MKVVHTQKSFHAMTLYQFTSDNTSTRLYLQNIIGYDKLRFIHSKFGQTRNTGNKLEGFQ